MDDELSEYITQISKDETSTPVNLSLVGPLAWQWFAQLSGPLPPPLQVFFNVKTPGTQLYVIVRTGKGKHAHAVHQQYHYARASRGVDTFTVYI